LSTSGLNKTFTVGQYTINSLDSPEIDITFYTTEKPALNLLNETTMDREVINADTIQVNESSYLSSGERINAITEFRNSYINVLNMNISSLAPEKTAMSVTVDFGDGETRTITRNPVITYTNFEDLISNDTRDPRNYMIRHTYTNQQPESRCVIRIKTYETPHADEEYVVRVVQHPVDITTGFGTLEGTGPRPIRSQNLDITIQRVNIYIDDYGSETMLLMLKTTNPSYIIPINLKLAEHIRQVNRYTRDNTTTEAVIDMSSIEAAYSNNNTIRPVNIY
jgi:hypothetical protein